ncbi:MULTISPECIES: hypothetical protein [unclassified Burkholderia]|uniref:hypothetical protein n=1 Tax=unclassified Burkholderia TaxID=2613784 RepID=UPI000F5F31D5|nr:MULTISPECIES: hypothetical protein [unclassified Burkholderia]
MKRRTDAGSFMLCGASKQRETEQKRYELFHWHCLKEFAHGEERRGKRNAIGISPQACHLTGDRANVGKNGKR